MSQICFPEGVEIFSYGYEKEHLLCKYEVLHYIITNQEGHKKYVTSLLFHVAFNTLNAE